MKTTPGCTHPADVPGAACHARCIELIGGQIVRIDKLRCRIHYEAQLALLLQQAASGAAPVQARA